VKTIGITTTVPIEVLMAAGYKPVDLNNMFIDGSNREGMVNFAEKAGFPQNCCTWIKGIYGVCEEHGIGTVLCVTGGDCSNTVMLMEVLKLRGHEVIPFAYPDEPDAEQMKEALGVLAERLGTTVDRAEKVRRGLGKARSLAFKVDELAWRDGLVSGLENHTALVTASDFNGSPPEYERRLEELINKCQNREPYSSNYLRLAYIGVPPVFARDLYTFIERNGARVVFNEVQRQFTMPFQGSSLAEQYSKYTYPYSIFGRVLDIVEQLQLRQVDGVIHYVQAFCHRGIGDIIFRDILDLPVLTLEGNNDFILNHHLRTRVEAFIDMLRRRSLIKSSSSSGLAT